jgi:DNA polymerase III epsilon subunit-like protein
VRLTTDPIEIVTLHLVFNPERRCSPGATGVHGFTNELLASQDPFGPYAAALSAWIGRAELVVAHNMEFDRRFLDEAFVSRGLPPIGPATACTMLEWRALGSGGARLDDIVARLQLTRRDKHGALEDAWLTMQAFLWLRGCPWKLDFAWIADPGPANLRAVAPPPPPAPKPPPLPKRPRGRPRKTEAKKDAGQTSPAA